MSDIISVPSTKFITALLEEADRIVEQLQLERKRDGRITNLNLRRAMRLEKTIYLYRGDKYHPLYSLLNSVRKETHLWVDADERSYVSDMVWNAYEN